MPIIQGTFHFFSIRANMGRCITTTLTPKTLNHNGVFYKFVLKKNKKRETIQVSSSGALPEATVEADEISLEQLGE